MTEETRLEILLRKIRALKAKADDPSTTEAESLAFAGKVAELLAKHGLEEAQLAVEDQEQMSHEEFDQRASQIWNASESRRRLLRAVGRLYMVSTLYWSNNRRWVFVGRKHNIIMTQQMAEYLIKTVSRLGNQYARANPLGDKTDFKKGCYSRLKERVDELRRQQAESAMPQYTSQRNPANLPALYKNEYELAHAYMRARWSFGYGPARRVRMGSDAAAGRQAAEGISLSQQVAAGSRSHYMIGRK